MRGFFVGYRPNNSQRQLITDSSGSIPSASSSSEGIENTLLPARLTQWQGCVEPSLSLGPCLFVLMNLRKNDILASNLLFASLLFPLSLRVYRWVSMGYDAQTEASYVPAAFPWHDMLMWTLLAVLVRCALYYGVRQGALGAKLLLLGVCLYTVYSSTDLSVGFVAGMDLASPSLWLLPIAAENLLTLAALVLMFKKPRAAAPTGS